MGHWVFWEMLKSRHKRYVKITLSGEVVEEPLPFPFLSPHRQLGLPLLLEIIDAARRHKAVDAMLLVIKNVSIGWGKIQELHHELERFHEAGKRSLAYLEVADNRSYYLASGTQRLYIPPSATLDLVGLRAEMFFLKNLLGYLGVEPQFFSLGEYKSAAETFTRENMSEAHRSMMDSILTDLQRQLMEKVALRRGVSQDQVQEWIDQGPFTARRAADLGLVDGLCYEDQVEGILKESKPALKLLPNSKLKLREGFFKKLITFRRPQIAYLVAEGILASGAARHGVGRRPLLDSETLIESLRTARKRKRVKAVVLRVNTPGGSALASDLIWRELRLTDEEKPVIVSFGDLAASGGYYIATAGRQILGMPGTLTGSIGVIQGKFNVRRLLDKLGITVGWLDKGERAGYSSPTRPFSEQEGRLIQEQLREFYEELFLKKVADSRQRPVEEIRELAEGRVWTGAQALGNGLLDRQGGLVQALESAQGKEGAGGSVYPAPQFARSVSVPMAGGFSRQSHAGFAGGPVRNSVTGAVERAIEQGNHGSVGCSTSLRRSDRSGVRGQLPPSSFPPTGSLQWSYPCPPPCTYRRGSGPP